MGRMLFLPETLGDSLSETVGYKAGLAVSIEQMCDLLTETDYPDLIQKSEAHSVIVRSEEYEDLFYALLNKVGHTEEKFDGDIAGVSFYHKYKHNSLKEYQGVLSLFVDIWPSLIEKTREEGGKSIDPTPFIQACFERFGRIGMDMAIEKIEKINKGLALNPYSPIRYVEWKNTEKLDSLFSGESNDTLHGRFIDQRFIDFLSVNKGQIGGIHWRKFEQLTAEYFNRLGFQVKLGPGRNDDGVDVRIWKPEQDITLPPHIIIQCKRQKENIEKVIIKSLFADIQFESADYGLLVTSSELSPGARKNIIARGYPIEEVNKDSIGKWLSSLRTPGTGIVRV